MLPLPLGDGWRRARTVLVGRSVVGLIRQRSGGQVFQEKVHGVGMGRRVEDQSHMCSLVHNYKANTHMTSIQVKKQTHASHSRSWCHMPCHGAYPLIPKVITALVFFHSFIAYAFLDTRV